MNTGRLIGWMTGLLLWASGLGHALALEVLPGEADIAKRVLEHAEQRRQGAAYDELLHFLARRKAEDMAKRAYFSHVDPDGIGPDMVARWAGYRHPYGSSLTGNSIESIGVRHQNNISATTAAGIVFSAWMDSPGHKTHLLGLQAGFAMQTRYGVGYAYAARGPLNYSAHYFVFVSAPPTNHAGYGPYVEWLFARLTLPQMRFSEEDPDADGVPNLVEYALDMDPVKADVRWPVVTGLDPLRRQVFAALPLRRDLDPSVRVTGWASADLRPGSWTTGWVERSGNTFYAGQVGAPVMFLRVVIERP